MEKLSAKLPLINNEAFLKLSFESDFLDSFFKTKENFKIAEKSGQNLKIYSEYF